MRRRSSRFWWVLVILFLLTSCKSWQKYVEPVFDQKNEEIFKRVENQYLSFDHLELKAKLKADFINKKNPLKVSIRINRDSIVWISLNLSTGLPVAKASFTKDSIRVIERVNNKVYVGNYDQLYRRKGIALSYNVIQSILLNEICACDTIETENQKIPEKDKYSSIYFVKNFKDTTQLAVTYKVNNKSNKVEAISILDKMVKLDVDYSNFEVVKSVLFPQHIALKTTKNNEEENIFIDITKAHIVKNQRYPFKIIKRFEVIEIDE